MRNASDRLVDLKILLSFCLEKIDFADVAVFGADPDFALGANVRDDLPD